MPFIDVKDMILLRALSLIQETIPFDSLTIGKEKLSILELIRNAQELDSQCRRISSQLCRKPERNSLFALAKNSILRMADHVFVP